MHPSFFVPSRAHQDHPRLPEKHRRPDGPAPRDYPHQSVNAQHYWKTLARQLALLAVLQFDDEQEEAWNEWVHNHPIPAELNRLFVVSTSTRPFQLRATIILLVPHVTAFTLFARPLCHNYRNLLHISRLWFPRVASFAPKEQAWVVKLLLLSAHTPLAQEADLRHYAWCAAKRSPGRSRSPFKRSSSTSSRICLRSAKKETPLSSPVSKKHLPPRARREPNKSSDATRHPSLLQPKTP
jgi:hypothetical protein